MLYLIPNIDKDFFFMYHVKKIHFFDYGVKKSASCYIFKRDMSIKYEAIALSFYFFVTQPGFSDNILNIFPSIVNHLSKNTVGLN